MSDPVPCVLEKALLTSTGRCRHATAFERGERLGYDCHSPRCAEQCHQWINLLRSHSKFIFRSSDWPRQPLTNQQEIRLQCGGVTGLGKLVDIEANSPIADISSLLGTAISRYQGLDDIPLQQVVTEIAACEPRPGRKRRK